MQEQILGGHIYIVDWSCFISKTHFHLTKMAIPYMKLTTKIGNPFSQGRGAN